jgi:periplasmic protein TonB
MSYLNQATAPRNVSTMLLVGSAHVAVLAALALAAFEAIPEHKDPIGLIDVVTRIEEPLPPPPDIPNLQPTPKPHVPEPVYQVDHAPVVEPILSATPHSDPGPSSSPSGADVAPPPPLPPVTITAPVRVKASYDPRFADRMMPDYPMAAIRMEAEGTVVLRVFVGTDGRIKDAQVAASSGNDFLDQAAVRHALRAWRFKPATDDGIAVASWTQVPVKFELATLRR